MPMSMPSQQDLLGAYGDWNPLAYVQAQQQYQNQSDLANQFAQQDLAQEAEKTRHAQTSNPLLEQQQTLQNQGLGYSNAASDLKNQNSLRDWTNRQQIDPVQEQQAMRSKLMREVSDDDIKQAENHIQNLALSDDPTERSHGIQAMQGLKDFVKQRDLLNSQESIHAGNNATSIAVANIAANSRQNIAANRGGAKSITPDFESSLLKVKKAHELHAMLVQEAAKVQDDNPDLAGSYLARAAAVEPQARAELSQAGTPVTNIVTGPDGKRSFVTSPRGSNVPGLSPTTTQNLLSKLPPGSKDNGDGTFTLPSGTRLKPKGQ